MIGYPSENRRVEIDSFEHVQFEHACLKHSELKRKVEPELPEIIMLPLTRRQLDFVGRAALIAAGYIRNARGDLEEKETPARIASLLAGFEQMYDGEDLADLMRKFLQLGAK